MTLVSITEEQLAAMLSDVMGRVCTPSTEQTPPTQSSEAPPHAHAGVPPEKSAPQKNPALTLDSLVMYLTPDDLKEAGPVPDGFNPKIAEDYVLRSLSGGIMHVADFSQCAYDSDWWFDHVYLEPQNDTATRILRTWLALHQLGPVPSSFSPFPALRSLMYPGELFHAFTWTETPQGGEHWAAVYEGDRLMSVGDRAYIVGQTLRYFYEAHRTREEISKARADMQAAFNDFAGKLEEVQERF